ADLRSGEMCFTIWFHLVINVFDGGAIYPDRGGIAEFGKEITDLIFRHYFALA
ncbi:hypothetical protein SAMN02982996_03367, partial [Lonsdalea quercina]